METVVDIIPNEIWFKILRLQTMDDLLTIRTVCKKFWIICNDRDFQQSLGAQEHSMMLKLANSHTPFGAAVNDRNYYMYRLWYRKYVEYRYEWEKYVDAKKDNCDNSLPCKTLLGLYELFWKLIDKDNITLIKLLRSLKHLIIGFNITNVIMMEHQTTSGGKLTDASMNRLEKDIWRTIYGCIRISFNKNGSPVGTAYEEFKKFEENFCINSSYLSIYASI